MRGVRREAPPTSTPRSSAMASEPRKGCRVRLPRQRRPPRGRPRGGGGEPAVEARVQRGQGAVVRRRRGPRVRGRLPSHPPAAAGFPDQARGHGGTIGEPGRTAAAHAPAHARAASRPGGRPCPHPRHRLRGHRHRVGHRACARRRLPALARREQRHGPASPSLGRRERGGEGPMDPGRRRRTPDRARRDPLHPGGDGVGARATTATGRPRRRDDPHRSAALADP